MNAIYRRTVQLLIEIAPAIFASPVFAMKGGTALSLFVQEMPRLSVDIDVVFVRHDLPREAALEMIGAELMAAKTRIEALGFQAQLATVREGNDAKLLVSNRESTVKVEVNFVFRGTVLPPVSAQLTQAAQDLFTANIEVPVLATAELYGSKLVAAMDRQHPRDLFDVDLMYSSFGLSTDIVDCFVVYLSGHNRPIHEVLFPTEKDIDTLFEAEFSGMTRVPVTLEALKVTRRRLLGELPNALTDRQRGFLLSLARAEPDWSLLPYPHIGDLPAIRWKLENLIKLRKNAGKFQQQYDALAARLAN